METYRTSDMSLVAYLALHGHMYQSIELVAGTDKDVVWLFAITGDLLDLVDEYQIDGNDYKAFTQTLANVRRSMYDFQAGLVTHA